MTTEGERPPRDYSQFSPIELNSELRTVFQLLPGPRNLHTGGSASDEDIELVKNLQSPKEIEIVDLYKELFQTNILDEDGYRFIAQTVRRRRSEYNPVLNARFKKLLAYSQLSQPLQKLLEHDFSDSVDMGINRNTLDRDPIYQLLGLDTFDTAGIFDPNEAEDYERRLIRYYKVLEEGKKRGNIKSTSKELIDKATKGFTEKYGRES